MRRYLSARSQVSGPEPQCRLPLEASHRATILRISTHFGYDQLRRQGKQFMQLNGEQLDVVRQKALELLYFYVPFERDDARYAEVVSATGWVKTPNSGTTCGFLCHWLMWRLGVANSDIVNWNDQERGLRFVPGRNISNIYNHGASPFIKVGDPFRPIRPSGNPAENTMVSGASCPLAGDIVFIREPG